MHLAAQSGPVLFHKARSVTVTLENSFLAPRTRPTGRSGLWLAEARALMLLAAPLIATQLAQMATMTTDVIMLGRLSKTALASAAIGGAVFYFAWLIGGGPAAAVAPMIAQAVGARERDRAGVRAALRMGLWAVAIISPPMMAMLWFARPILVGLRQDPVLAAGAGQFVAMLSFGLPFSLSFMVLRNFATALGRPGVALWVSAATIAWNAAADWALIFGHLGAPRLGIAGAGLATSSSAAFGCLALIVAIRLDRRLAVWRVFRRFHRPSRARLAEVFRLGMPIGMAMIFEAMLFNTMTLVMGTFGVATVAAHQIAMSVASITFMVPLGVGLASTVRVGLAAGREDLAGARRAGLTAMGVALGFIFFCATAMALFGRQIASLYFGGAAGSADRDVISLATLFLEAAAAFQVFDAVQVVAGLCLRGLKDARWPMILAGGAYWLIGAPACFFLAFGLGLRGLGVWIGFVVALAAAAVVLAARFWRLTRPVRKSRDQSEQRKGVPHGVIDP